MDTKLTCNAITSHSKFHNYIQRALALWILLPLINISAQSPNQYIIDDIKCSGLDNPIPSSERYETVMGIIAKSLKSTQSSDSICFDLFSNLGIQKGQTIGMEDLNKIQNRLSLYNRYLDIKLALEKADKKYYIILWAHFKHYPRQTSADFNLKYGWESGKNKQQDKTLLHVEGSIDVDSQGLNQPTPVRFSFFHKQNESREPLVLRFEDDTWNDLRADQQVKLFQLSSQVSQMSLQIFTSRHVNYRYFIESSITANYTKNDLLDIWDFGNKLGYQHDFWVNTPWWKDVLLSTELALLNTSYHDYNEGINEGIYDDFTPLTSISYFDKSIWINYLGLQLNLNHPTFFVNLFVQRAIDKLPSYRWSTKIAFKLFQIQGFNHWFSYDVKKFNQIKLPKYFSLPLDPLLQSSTISIDKKWQIIPIKTELFISYKTLQFLNKAPNGSTKFGVNLNWNTHYINAGIELFIDTKRKY